MTKTINKFSKNYALAYKLQKKTHKEVKMRNTIKAKVGYEVRHLKSKPDTVRVYDGDNFLFEGEMRTYEDYVDELVNAGNEAARKCEVFTTVKGNQFVYWRDEEADWDLITKIN